MGARQGSAPSHACARYLLCHQADTYSRLGGIRACCASGVEHTGIECENGCRPVCWPALSAHLSACRQLPWEMCLDSMHVAALRHAAFTRQPQPCVSRYALCRRDSHCRTCSMLALSGRHSQEVARLTDSATAPTSAVIWRRTDCATGSFNNLHFGHCALRALIYTLSYSCGILVRKRCLAFAMSHDPLLQLALLNPRT